MAFSAACTVEQRPKSVRGIKGALEDRLAWSLPPTNVSSLPPWRRNTSRSPKVSVTSAMLREPSCATCGYLSMLTVCQSKFRSCSSQWNWVTPRKNGGVPFTAVRFVPGSSPNQMRWPSWLRGPSQIMSIARASRGVRQFVAGAVGAPQILAVALKWQVRGSSMMPSVTPSAASHAVTADAVVWLSFAAEIGPPSRSFVTICLHIMAV